MKLKLTYERAGGSAVDLVATVDSKATVGDLAEYLLAADPEHRTVPGDEHTLCLLERRQLLDRAVPITDSPLGSGVRVGVLPASARYSDQAGQSGAKLELLQGVRRQVVQTVVIVEEVLFHEDACDILQVLATPSCGRFCCFSHSVARSAFGASSQYRSQISNFNM